MVLLKSRNELGFRRRYMLDELRRIFFPPYIEPALKRRCECERFDIMRGLHMPALDAAKGGLRLEKNLSMEEFAPLYMFGQSELVRKRDIVTYRVFL